MAQLDRLIRDARKAMQARGHTPAPARRSMGKGAAIIKCTHCTCEAHVVCKPQPAEQRQISGYAVIMNCNVATDTGLVAHTDGRGNLHWNNEIRMDAVFGC